MPVLIQKLVRLFIGKISTRKNAAGEYELDKNGQPIVEERVKVENG